MAQRFYGLLPTTPDHRDYRFSAPRQYTGQFVDLSSGIVRVLDQDQLGACVPHGVTYAIEYALKKQGSATDFQPSRLFIYYNGRVIGKCPLNQDTGLQIRDGVQSAVQFGAPLEFEWPYNITKFAERPPVQDFVDGLEHQALKYAQVDADAIDDAIASGYLVLSGFDVYSSFESDTIASTGIMSEPNRDREQLLGGHCTDYVTTALDGAQIPGPFQGVKGLKYRKKVNSWNSFWGQKGFYWEPVTVQEQDASDFWVITSVEDPAVNPPQPPSGNPDADFATVLKPWIPRKHTSINHNNRVAAAASKWINEKGL